MECDGRAAAHVAHLRVISKRLPSASPRWSCSCTSSKLPTRAPRMHLFSDVKRRGGTCSTLRPSETERSRHACWSARHIACRPSAKGAARVWALRPKKVQRPLLASVGQAGYTRRLSSGAVRHSLCMLNDPTGERAVSGVLLADHKAMTGCRGTMCFLLVPAEVGVLWLAISGRARRQLSTVHNVKAMVTVCGTKHRAGSP